MRRKHLLAGFCREMRWWEGTRAVVRFYTVHLRTLREIYAPLEALTLADINHDTTWTARVCAKHILTYNTEYEKLKNTLRALDTTRDFQSIVQWLVIVRVLALLAALLFSPIMCVAVSALQFVVAPYSLVVSAMHFFTDMSTVVSHYLVACACSLLLSATLPGDYRDYVLGLRLRS